MNELDAYLTHTGIKGMKWGIRRDRNRPGGADGKEESTKIVDNRSKLRKNLDSLKREREWKKVLKDIDHMSTNDISTVTKRISLENSLKKLSKSKIARAKDKQDYLNRDKMSNDELSRKIVRLRAKENLYNTIRDASKEQRELGERVVNVAGNIAFKYAKTKIRPSLKDIYDTSMDKKIKPVKDLVKEEAAERIKKKIDELNKKPQSTP